MRRASSSVARGIVEMLEHVPDHDLVEVRGRIGGGGQIGCDPDLGARIGAARGLERDLDAVHLEASIRERAEDHAAAAADVEHARAGRQVARKKADVSLADPAHAALDEALELAAGLAVVFARVEGSDLCGIGQRMQAPESAALADDHARSEALDRERGVGLLRAADETRRHGLRRPRPRAEDLDLTLIQGVVAQERSSRGCAGTCAAWPKRSREARGRRRVARA